GGVAGVVGGPGGAAIGVGRADAGVGAEARRERAAVEVARDAHVLVDLPGVGAARLRARVHTVRRELAVDQPALAFGRDPQEEERVEDVLEALVERPGELPSAPAPQRAR